MGEETFTVEQILDLAAVFATDGGDPEALSWYKIAHGAPMWDTNRIEAVKAAGLLVGLAAEYSGKTWGEVLEDARTRLVEVQDDQARRNLE